MIDYAKVALVTLIIFGIIILLQNIYMMTLADKSDVSNMKKTARYGAYISGIMLGLGVLILITVMLTEKGLKKERTTESLYSRYYKK